MSEDLFPADSWLSGATAPSAIVNDNARRLEVALLPALSFEATQPGSPVAGGLYVLSADWGSGVENDLAYYLDGAWTYWTPFDGLLKDVGGVSYQFDGADWNLYSPGVAASIAIQYVADTGSTADSDPGAGLLKWNHATQASATFLYLDDDTEDGVSLAALWANLDAGGFIFVQHATDQDTWQIWEITAVTDATGYVKLAVSLIANGGSFADDAPMLVQIEQGSAGGGILTGTISNGDTTHAPTGDAVFDALALKTNVAIVPNTAPSAGQLLVGNAGGTAYAPVSASGDVAVSSAGAMTVANDAITNAKAANMATLTIKGRVTGSTGDPEDLTAAQAASIVQADGLTADACGFRGIPQVSFSANTTIAATHGGKHLYHPSSDANTRTVTIDSNTNLALPIGFTFTVINDTAQVVSIAITSDTLVLGSTGSTGTRALAQYGVATAIKVTSTRWVITGVALT